jgi:hypothetical protein
VQNRQNPSKRGHESNHTQHAAHTSRNTHTGRRPPRRSETYQAPSAPTSTAGLSKPGVNAWPAARAYSQQQLAQSRRSSGRRRHSVPIAFLRRTVGTRRSHRHPRLRASRSVRKRSKAPKRLSWRWDGIATRINETHRWLSWWQCGAGSLCPGHTNVTTRILKAGSSAGVEGIPGVWARSDQVAALVG